jgi:N-acetylglucosamine-6-phosphate deacetylase
MATSMPARVLRSDLGFGRLATGGPANAIYLDRGFETVCRATDL